MNPDKDTTLTDAIDHASKQIRAERDKEIIDALVEAAKELDKHNIPRDARWALEPGHPLLKVFLP